MYALKARDKLHKMEKDEEKGRKKQARKRERGQDAHHRGESSQSQSQPSVTKRDAKYIGTFSVTLTAEWKRDLSKTVQHQLSRMDTKHPSSCMLVSVLVNTDGVKVLTADGRSLIMAHALNRILYCTADTKKSLFAMVARNPQTGPDGVYSHVFLLSSKQKANDLSELVGKAFKAAFTKQTLKRAKKTEQRHSHTNLHASLPWSSQPSNSSEETQPSAPTQSLLNAPPPSYDELSSLPPPQQQLYPPLASSPVPSPSPTPQQQLYPPPLASSPAPSPSPTPQQHLYPPLAPSPVPHASNPSPTPRPPSGEVRRPSPSPRSSQLVQEASELEAEVLQLHSRVHELETRLAQVSAMGDEGTAMDLTMQLSAYQQQLDAKGRRLFDLQGELTGGGGGGGGGGGAMGGGGGGGGGAIGGGGGGGWGAENDFVSLENAEWFQAGLPREIAMEILSQQEEGSFLVRHSSSSPGCYALSLRGPQGVIAHYLIESVEGGVKIQNSSTVFPSVPALILHHSLYQEFLPTTLSFSTANPTFLEHDTPSPTDDDDYLQAFQYQLLDS